MNLNKRTMTYRLYAVCYIMSKKLFGKERSWILSHGALNMPKNTNLCTLMRTILLWTPVYLVLFLGLITGITYTAFILPATLGGIMGYVNTYLIPGGIIGSIVLIMWGTILGYTKYIKNNESSENKEARHEAGNYTFYETSAQYFTALHDKTCPLITVVEEPVVATPAPEPNVVDDSDEDNTSTDAAHSKEFEIAVDAIIESLDSKTSAVELKLSPVNLFLAKWLPSFWPMAALAIATAIVVLINIGMANIMETEPVVFQKAECVASYNVESSFGKIVCGEYETYIAGNFTLDFVNDTVILKKKPYCSVEKGTYTEDTTFDCEYKATE